jgi:hypothetical protein
MFSYKEVMDKCKSTVSEVASSTTLLLDPRFTFSSATESIESTAGKGEAGSHQPAPVPNSTSLKERLPITSLADKPMSSTSSAYSSAPREVGAGAQSRPPVGGKTPKRGSAPPTQASIAATRSEADFSIFRDMSTKQNSVESEYSDTSKCSSRILSNHQVAEIEKALPIICQLCQWKMVYSLTTHGASVETLILNSRKHSVPQLLVVRDEQGTTFGALITDPLRAQDKEKYYGGGDNSVWTFKSGKLQFFSWSQLNNYFLLTSRESIALGGGGSFALYLDSDLNKGSSGCCDTFQSPCLSYRENFSCMSCELFCFL